MSERKRQKLDRKVSVKEKQKDIFRKWHKIPEHIMLQNKRQTCLQKTAEKYRQVTVKGHSSSSRL